MDSILRRLVRHSIRRAMSGEHAGWFIVACSLEVLRRMRHSDEEYFEMRVARGTSLAVTFDRHEHESTIDV